MIKQLVYYLQTCLLRQLPGTLKFLPLSTSLSGRKALPGYWQTPFLLSPFWIILPVLYLFIMVGFFFHEHCKINYLKDSQESDLNEHHSSQLVSYMRFAEYQRGQCVRSIKATVQDTKVMKRDVIVTADICNSHHWNSAHQQQRIIDIFKETRLLDDTFTIEEVEEIIAAVEEVILINNNIWSTFILRLLQMK